MPISLSDIEARLLGSLIEKSLTTPESYPLTLNALLNACNQKSSREPVMYLDEPTVARGLATLREKGLVFQKSEAGNRVPKFAHRVENLLNGGSTKEVGAICVLLLRGAQTPGEIKTRTERLCEYESVAEVVTVLDELAHRSDGPFIARLSRQPGQKETRYIQLFTPTTETPTAETPETAPKPAPKPVVAPSMPTAADRVAQLEKRVQALEAAVAELRGASERSIS